MPEKKALSATKAISSSGDKHYAVTEWDDGTWTCTCPYGLNRKKTWCKHVKKVRAERGLTGEKPAQKAKGVPNILKLSGGDELELFRYGLLEIRRADKSQSVRLNRNDMDRAFAWWGLKKNEI